MKSPEEQKYDDLKYELNQSYKRQTDVFYAALMMGFLLGLFVGSILIRIL